VELGSVRSANILLLVLLLGALTGLDTLLHELSFTLFIARTCGTTFLEELTRLLPLFFRQPWFRLTIHKALFIIRIRTKDRGQDVLCTLITQGDPLLILFVLLAVGMPRRGCGTGIKITIKGFTPFLDSPALQPTCSLVIIVTIFPGREGILFDTTRGARRVTTIKGLRIFVPHHITFTRNPIRTLPLSFLFILLPCFRFDIKKGVDTRLVITTWCLQARTSFQTAGGKGGMTRFTQGGGFPGNRGIEQTITVPNPFGDQTVIVTPVGNIVEVAGFHGQPQTRETPRLTGKVIVLLQFFVFDSIFTTRVTLTTFFITQFDGVTKVTVVESVEVGHPPDIITRVLRVAEA